MRVKNLLFYFTFSIFACFLLTPTYAGKKNPATEQEYTLQFKGKVTFKRPEGEVLGMYGAKVVLNTMVQYGNNTPYDLQSLTNDPKDYVAEIAPDGSFHINLKVKKDLKYVKYFFLQVFPESKAGYVQSDEKQFITKTSSGEIYVLEQPANAHKRGLRFSYDNNKVDYIYNNLNIEVNSKIGVTTRYFRLSYDVAQWLITTTNVLWPEVKNVPPVNIRIGTDKSELPSGYTPSISHPSQPNFFITPERANRVDVVHEYGHYFHDLLNHKYMAKNQNDDERVFIEGFANFYGMLVLNFTANLYQDKTVLNYFVHEGLPYLDPPYSGANYDGLYGNNVARFTTYLFNLYDGPTQNYMQPKHQGMDNDDIDGKKHAMAARILNTIHQLGKNDGYISSFHNKITSQVLPEVRSSMDDMFKTIFLRWSIKDILSAQVKSALMSIANNGKKHFLQIQTFEYTTTGTEFYKNAPNGYNVYGENDGEWKLIKNFPEKPQPIKYYDIDSKDIEGYSNFKITSYNDAGESLYPLEFKNSTLPVSIEGPTEVFADKSYQWKAKVTGGTNPILYTWSLKKVNSNEYFPGGINEASGLFNSMPPQGESFILQVFAKDFYGKTGFAELPITTTIKPLKVNVNGMGSVIANENTKWTAATEGGVPPYKFSWSKKVEGGAFNLVGYGDSYTTKTDKNLTLTLHIQDSKGSSAFDVRNIIINPYAAIIPTVSGDPIAYLHKDGHWKVAVTGGLPPYKITWLAKKEGLYNFYAPFGQGNELSNTFSAEGSYILKAKIEDQNGKIGESPEFKVNAVYQNMLVNINNNIIEEVNPGDHVNCLATINGGKPPYKATWKLGKTINTLVTVAEVNNTDDVVNYSYKTKIIDKGKYIITLTITDDKNKSSTVYKEFTVKAKPIVIGEPGNQEELNAQQNSITFFPNPVQSNMTVGFDLQNDGYVEMMVINNNTKQPTKVYQGQHTKGMINKVFNLAAFQSGVYTLQITLKDKKAITTTTISKQFVIAR